MAVKVGNGGPESTSIPKPPPLPPAPPPFVPAFYTFRLDSFKITNTRALHEDTDCVTIGVKVGDQVFKPQTKSMGNLNNGTYRVGMQIGPVLVNKPDESIAFNYQIVNSGHKDPSDVAKQLEAGAVAALVKIFSLSTPWTAVLTVVGEFIMKLISLNCDGPCAVDQINVKGEDLWAWTHGVGTHSQTKFYTIDSQGGCGSSPEYYVSWSIVGAGLAPHVIPGVLVGHPAA